MFVLIAHKELRDARRFKKAFTIIEPRIKLAFASTGLEVFNIARSLLPKLPDVIFFDIDTPVLNGKEFLYLAKKEVLLQKVPIIIYASHYNQKTMIECFNLGAHHFMVKGRSDELVNDLKTIVFTGALRANDGFRL